MKGNQLCCYLDTQFHCRACDRVWCSTCCDHLMDKSDHRWVGNSDRNYCPVAGEVIVGQYRRGPSPGWFEKLR